MKTAIPWAVGAVLTFAVVSSAFLLLANLGTESGGIPLEPRESLGRTSSPLEIRLDEGQLESLRENEGQDLRVQLRNSGSRSFPDVNLLVEVYSEDTAAPDAKLYRKALEGLDSGDTAEVSFTVDLSSESRDEPYPGSDQPRKIIEVRATTPGGVSGSRTVILPVQGP